MKKTSKPNQYIFILWGEYFEEVPAAFFITMIREAGLTAKVVSATGRHRKGAHGLELISDMTLEQALLLAANTICVMIPGGLPVLERLKSDPRIQVLFERAHSNRAKFVVDGTGFTYLISFFPTVALEDVLIYSSNDSLSTFMSEVILALHSNC